MNTNTISLSTQDFQDFRHLLHKYPEVSEFEFETKKKIQDFIAPFKPDVALEVGRTGLLFGFGSSARKSIMIRAELDALPIQEINTFDHQSVFDGVSHKCGHDGHSVILCRLAYNLSLNRPDNGMVYLLFQPAEENGMGAKEVSSDAKFQNLKIDAVVSLHNIPGFPLGQVNVRKGAFTPAVCSMIVKFYGKTSHAAEPEKGINPALAMAEFLTEALRLAIPDTYDDNFFLVTPVYTTMGEESYGISAGYGEVHLTIRSWDNKILEQKSLDLEKVALALCKAYGLRAEISWTQEFQANNNDSEMVDLIEKSATELNIDIKHLATPMKWGEDFGLFTENFKGAMFGLGSGINQPALHNPDYDFPDELIVIGSDIFEQIARNFLNER